jgi:hypothetical protein
VLKSSLISHICDRPLQLAIEEAKVNNSRICEQQRILLSFKCPHSIYKTTELTAKRRFEIFTAMKIRVESATSSETSVSHSNTTQRHNPRDLGVDYYEKCK